jgi:hypothetical protein
MIPYLMLYSYTPHTLTSPTCMLAKYVVADISTAAWISVNIVSA